MDFIVHNDFLGHLSGKPVLRQVAIETDPFEWLDGRIALISSAETRTAQEKLGEREGAAAEFAHDDRPSLRMCLR